MADEEAEARGEAGGKAGVVAESIRRALVTGISAVFMTEEGIRNALAEIRLPKEAIQYLLQQTANSRRELTRIVSDELKGFLKSADIAGALRKALTGMKLEVRAEIRLVDGNGHTPRSERSEEGRAGSRRRN